MGAPLFYLDVKIKGKYLEVKIYFLISR